MLLFGERRIFERNLCSQGRVLPVLQDDLSVAQRLLAVTQRHLPACAARSGGRKNTSGGRAMASLACAPRFVSRRTPVWLACNTISASRNGISPERNGICRSPDLMCRAFQRVWRAAQSGLGIAQTAIILGRMEPDSGGRNRLDPLANHNSGGATAREPGVPAFSKFQPDPFGHCLHHESNIGWFQGETGNEVAPAPISLSDPA